MKLRPIASHHPNLPTVLLGLAVALATSACDGPAPNDAREAAESEEASDPSADELAASATPAASDGPSCKTICERGVRECEHAHSNASDSEIEAQTEKCISSCEDNDLQAQDIACWAEAPCGAFLGRTTNMKVGVCHSQRALDNKGKNNAKLVSDLKKKLVEAAKRCEADKTPKAVAESARKSKDKDAEPAVRRAPGDVQAEHLKVTHQVTSQLYTPFLTTTCKEALAKAAHEAHAKCINGEEDDVDWLEDVGDDACASA